jgi:uncharacterized membrane protein
VRQAWLTGAGNCANLGDMTVHNRRLQQVYRYAARHAIVPVALCSLLALGLLTGRAYRSRTIVYAGLVWNLFLAWVPYLISLWADLLHRRHPRRWWVLILPGALWLAFFPNAPYMITALAYLQDWASIPQWYDIGLLAAFALSGLFLAIYSLRTMQHLVGDYLGSILSWFFVFAVLGLAGLGIYLGRFLRWNSWDLVLHPGEVLGDVGARLADPLSYPRTLGVTLLFAALLFVCYLALTAREPA